SSYENAVREKLQDKSPRVRKVAVRTLKKMGVKGVVAPESFHSKDEWKFITRSWKTNKIERMIADLYDRRKAIRAKKYLANYGPEVLEFVVPLVNDKNNENVRVDALYVIGQVGDSSYEDVAIEKLLDRNRRVRQEAARTLTMIGTEKSIEPLKELLNDYNPNIRFNALRAIARIAPKKEKGLFVEALGNYDPRIRIYAVKALGDIKADDTLDYLSQLAQDEDPAVRYELARTLGKIGTEECLPTLKWLTNDPELNIRLLALKNIAKLNTPKAEEPLVKAAKGFDPRVAAKAILALGKMRSPKALGLAKRYLNDEHMTVRVACITVIGQMGSKDEKKKLLKPLLEAESTLVRKKAKEALAEVNSGQ
ncbi:MAG: HEAT repeat domain-containing protein, partial [Candidatus Omnitrophota bacterium]